MCNFIPTWGGGYKANFLRSVIFRIFCIIKTHVIYWICAFIFDRCRRSSAAVVPVKYKCCSNNPRGIFCKNEHFACEGINERNFSNPHSCCVMSHHTMHHRLIAAIKCPQSTWSTLQWRHNECHGVSNHRRLDCLLNRGSGAHQRKHQSSASPGHQHPWYC